MMTKDELENCLRLSLDMARKVSKYKPQNMFLPGVGWLIKDGMPTDIGIEWAKKIETPEMKEANEDTKKS